MFCDADFEGGICCNPGSNPAALRIQGITTPGDRNFAFYDPALQALKLPALRAVVAEQGAFTTPALSACFFFVLRRAIEIGPNLLRKPLVGQGLPLPRRRAHSALQRGTWGALCALCQERLRLLPPLPFLQAEHLLLVAVIHRRLGW